jgi:hypothetical protein
MQNVVFTNQIEGVEVVFSTKSQQGRPVDPNSVRQQRLNSAPGKRTGRKINPNSSRQQRLAEMEARKEANGGEVKRGRPASSDSARQKAIAERQALLDAGVVIKRGRPVGSGKKVELDSVEEVKVEVKKKGGAKKQKA